MRYARAILGVSIAVNIMLMAAAIALWSNRSGHGPPLITESAAETESSPGISEEDEAGPGTGPVVPLPFHWSQVESEDFRQYMANLRAMGCPESLIRDMVLVELEEVFRKRRSQIQREPVPPWAGRDRRQAMQEEYNRRLHDLAEEQRTVTMELLGFAGSKKVRTDFLNDATTAILLGHLPYDQAFQTMELLLLYEERARWTRTRARNILLEEDWDELAALDKELKQRLVTSLTPSDWEECLLRINCLQELAEEGHFELAGLTGAELRRLVQLYTRRVDGIAESLIMSRVVTEAELMDRQRELEADWVAAFGPAKAAALKRARDDRFHELLEFAQQRQLSPETAVSAYEIRLAAEEEIQRLRGDPSLDSSLIAERFDEVQKVTTEALTRLLGPVHMGEYISGAGGWLELDRAGANPMGEVVP
jgi:hypothetical protein